MIVARGADKIEGRSALEGQLGHQITNATARPFSILQIQLADLGGYLPFQMCSRID